MRHDDPAAPGTSGNDCGMLGVCASHTAVIEANAIDTAFHQSNNVEATERPISLIRAMNP